MNKHHHIVSELQRLLDQQLQAIKGRLGPEEVAQYTLRAHRIRRLLEDLVATGSGE